jgi:adenosylmethionine---8-amino-7-oxononanoate aminotransferase
MSVSERGYFTAPFSDKLFPVTTIPHPSVNIAESLQALSQECQKGDVLALIYEPLIQGASGMKFYDPTHLESMLEICKSHGIICIADEIFTGFFRTGTFFASDQTPIRPDIICLSKALTGGTLPLGLTIATEKIWEKFHSDKKEHMLLHGHSFTGNPLACAAALASLDLIEQDNFSENLLRIEKLYSSKAPEVARWPLVTNVRYKGLVFALDIEAHDSGYGSSIKDTLYPYFLNQGTLLRPLGNVLYLVPPVCITNEELEKVFSVIENSLRFLLLSTDGEDTED